VRAHLYVPALRQLGEHPVRLGHAERSLERGTGSGDLPMPSERLEELFLLIAFRNPTRPRRQKARHPPGGNPECRYQDEGEHPEEENEREEAREKRSRRKQEDHPSNQQAKRLRDGRLLSRVRPNPLRHTRVNHPSRASHLASAPSLDAVTTLVERPNRIPTYFAAYHDIS
jgi:hypothetical protein